MFFEGFNHKGFEAFQQFGVIVVVCIHPSITLPSDKRQGEGRIDVKIVVESYWTSVGLYDTVHVNRRNFVRMGSGHSYSKGKVADQQEIGGAESKYKQRGSEW